MGRLWYTTAGGKRKRTKAGIKHEYEKFQSSPKAIAERSARNSARRKAIKTGLIRKGDNRDIDHINSNPLDNRPSNLRAISKRRNRGKIENSRRKGIKRNIDRWGL